VLVELGSVGALPGGRLLSHAAITAQWGRIASDRAALRFALRGLRYRVLLEVKTIPDGEETGRHRPAGLIG